MGNKPDKKHHLDNVTHISAHESFVETPQLVASERFRAAMAIGDHEVVIGILAELNLDARFEDGVLKIQTKQGPKTIKQLQDIPSLA